MIINFKGVKLLSYDLVLMIFRIKTYNESTLPIIQHFDQENMVKRIDAGKTEAEVNN